jgi:hypothetical protein
MLRYSGAPHNGAARRLSLRSGDRATEIASFLAVAGDLISTTEQHDAQRFGEWLQAEVTVWRSRRGRREVRHALAR